MIDFFKKFFPNNQGATMETKPAEKFLYTEEQLMARLKFFIGVCLAVTLTGIVFVVLYSIIFVTQPLGAISPIDQKFFELIIPIATFLTGTLSGIMLAGGAKKDEEPKYTEPSYDESRYIPPSHDHDDQDNWKYQDDHEDKK